MQEHVIMVTYASGDTVTYKTRIFHGRPERIGNSPLIVEIVDLDTGEILFSAA